MRRRLMCRTGCPLPERAAVARLGSASHRGKADRSHCVVRVSDSDDAGDEWNRLSVETIGVTLTIDSLVMETHNG